MESILVLEDDSDLAALIAQHLQAMDYSVTTCSDGLTGLRQAKQHEYDLLLLDIGLPELDGLEVCRKYRQFNEMTPILMLTARNSEFDRVLGLELGADDYLGKPFAIRELQARVKALLRRQKLLGKAAAADDGEVDNMIHCHNMLINPARHEVLLHGRPINVTAREFDILFFLASNAGRVYNRGQLLNSIWGYTNNIYEHTVNSNINRLRGKIEQDSNNPVYVLTVRGVGYKFNDAMLAGNSARRLPDIQ